MRASLVGVAAVLLGVAAALATPRPSASTSRPPSPTHVSGIRIAAAGDIACDPSDGTFHDGRGRDFACRQRATSDVLVGAGYVAVLALGDIQYEDGARADFDLSYDPAWGRVKAITRPVPGNHDYGTPGAAGYYDYFGEAAGDRVKGYYSYDLGRWHLIALNSNCSAIGGCGAGSLQEVAARRPRRPSGARARSRTGTTRASPPAGTGATARTRAFWQALVDGGRRRRPRRARPRLRALRAAGRRADGSTSSAGVREFVVGTGGKSLRRFLGSRPNSEARDRSSFGVLELTLGAGVYAWRFVSAVGFFADAGAARCH